MKSEVKIPEVGESISEVTIGQWMKKDGDSVEMDEVICEIESEKATLEIQADREGVLKILAEEGETVSVGEKIAEIDAEAESAAESQPAGEEEAAEETGSEAAEAEKTGETGPAPEGGGEEETAEEEDRPKISPVAARMLRDAGIPRGQVKGSGPGGRVTKADAQQAINDSRREKTPEKEKSSEKAPEKEAEKAPQPPVIGGPEPAKAPAVPKRDGGRSEQRRKMSTLRKTIAKRLVAAKNETAMLTTFNEVDMSEILALRSRYKEIFQEKHDIKLGFMSFFVKACCQALAEFPEVNAMIEGEEIVYHDYCDISIAVSTPKGLVVPVIFDADRMSLPEIEAEVGRLAVKARDNKLTIDEMSGGTFSLTNGGVFGSLLSTPIINAPQSAILGMHKIEERPRAVNGEVVIRPMMYVALSYDHRIIDGKESVSFLVRVKELLEDPARLLLEV